MEKEMQKRGQITIFIIIGIIILMVAAVVIYVTSITSELNEFTPISVSELPTELAPVQLYVDACVERTLKDGLRRIGAHGGYVGLGVSDEIFTGKQFDIDYAGNDPTSHDALTVIPDDENSNVAYWYYLKSPNNCDNTGAGCVVSYGFPPLRKQEAVFGDAKSIEEQLSIFIVNNIEECSNGFGIFEVQGINITSEKEVKALVIIGADSTQAYVEYPLKIRGELTGNSELDKFHAGARVKLPQMYELAKNITSIQASSQFIEQIMLEMIGIYSDLDGPLPPTTEQDFGGAEKSWNVFSAQNRLKELSAIYYDSLQAENTKGYTAPSSFRNAWEESFYNHYQVLPIQNDYRNIAVDFSYLDIWPLYLKFNGGKDTVASSTSFTMLSMFGLPNLYEYEAIYDVSMPLLIELTDEDSDVTTSGFVFNIALEGNVRNNGVLSDYVLELPDVAGEYTPLGDPQYCNENQKTGGQLTIFIADNKGKPLDAAQIFIKSGNQNCYLGESQMVDGRSMYRGNAPQGYALLKVIKEDHLSYTVPVFIDEEVTIINAKLPKIYDIVGQAKFFKIKQKENEPIFDETVSDFIDEMEISTENLTDEELEDLFEDKWQFSASRPYELRNSESVQDSATVVLKRIKENPYEDEFAAVLKVTGQGIDRMRLVEGDYNMTYVATSRLPEFCVPQRKRCAQRIAGQCLKRVIVNERTCFGGENEFFGGVTNQRVHISDFSDSQATIEFYGLYFDWSSIPESDRYISDMNTLNKFGDYSKAYADYLIPKAVVPR